MKNYDFIRRYRYSKSPITFTRKQALNKEEKGTSFYSHNLVTFLQLHLIIVRSLLDHISTVGHIFCYDLNKLEAIGSNYNHRPHAKQWGILQFVNK